MLEKLKAFKGEFDQSDIVCDEHSKDASVFMVRPQGVFYPKDTEDIVAVVRKVAEEKLNNFDVSLSVRAGGTCMTGGSLCTGYILNLTRHMHHIDINPVLQTATVEMGAYFRDIESRAEEHGLMFAPYPSSRSLCGIGGMIGNNASGEKSIRYGATSDNVLELEVVLADGSIVRVTPKNISEVNDEKEIELLNLYYSQGEALRNAVGHVPKASSGYRLDRILSGDTFSAIPLFVGAQGTLGIVTKAILKLVPIPQHLELVLISAPSMKDIPHMLAIIEQYNPEGLETFDRNTLRKAEVHLKESADKALPYLDVNAHLHILAQFGESTDIETKAKAEACLVALQAQGYHAKHITNAKDRESIWDIRRNAFLLMRDYNVKGQRAVPCIEDVIVPLESLGIFIEELREILKKHAVSFGYHGHIGDGSLRIIPIFDFTDPKVAENITKLMKETFALVKRLSGNISADHSDGIIRTPFLREFYGDELYQVFESIKRLYDPEGILNPHKKTEGTLTHMNICLDCP
jgi:FAD/FMN-containing dehydrogenase